MINNSFKFFIKLLKRICLKANNIHNIGNVIIK